jgi:ribosome-binding ATPase YchF (GTP1/OBG family)
VLRNLALLTSKPVLYVANVDESDPHGHSATAQKLRDRVESQQGTVIPVCAKLEAELVELEGADHDEMLKTMGLDEPALNVVARAAYRLLGMQSFFTCGPKEIRAWTIPIGATAPQAAGAIHSDFERGFIRVEVFRVPDLEQYHTEVAIKQHGKLRVEGKNYVVQEGDVCHFLFNVSGG